MARPALSMLRAKRPVRQFVRRWLIGEPPPTLALSPTFQRWRRRRSRHRPAVGRNLCNEFPSVDCVSSHEAPSAANSYQTDTVLWLEYKKTYRMSPEIFLSLTMLMKCKWEIYRWNRKKVVISLSRKITSTIIFNFSEIFSNLLLLLLSVIKFIIIDYRNEINMIRITIFSWDTYYYW